MTNHTKQNVISHPLVNFVFFGTSAFSLTVLKTLESSGFLPKLIVSTPSRPFGRKLHIKEPAVVSWAKNHGISHIQPHKFDKKTIEQLDLCGAEIFLVASFGKIIPEEVLCLPKLGAFNIHPSLLPKYRGPSPIQTQIINDEPLTGVTVIKMDSDIDHGPIMLKTALSGYERGSLGFKDMGETLFQLGTEMLVSDLPKLKQGLLTLSDQDHQEATFTRKFEKQDGLLDLTDHRGSWLKYLALSDSPGVYFMSGTKGKFLRVKVVQAEYKSGLFLPLRVIPEAKKEMLYEDFLRGFRK